VVYLLNVMKAPRPFLTWTCARCAKGLELSFGLFSRDYRKIVAIKIYTKEKSPGVGKGAKELSGQHLVDFKLRFKHNLRGYLWGTARCC